MVAWLVSSAQYLPGVNFETPVTINDLGFQFDTVFAGEQHTRLQLAMAGYSSTGAHYGIVDGTNPREVTSGSTRSFVVSAGANTTVDVQAGVAVTKSGNIIIINDKVSSLVLANPVLQNIPYIVYAEYSTIDDTTTNTLTRYNTVEARRRVFATTAQVIKVSTLSDYQNPSVFTPDRLNDIVVLAVVTNSTTAGSLVIDLSNNTNSFNRPWFSPVDIEHRSLIGTGSSLVPHSLGLNDISQGNLTLYQQMLRHGIVISKDYDVPGCPGKLNLEVINTVRVLTDATGTHTGVVGQRYVNLTAYPLRILAARSRTNSNNDIAVSFIPNSNMLLIPTLIATSGSEQSSETIPVDGFDLYYTASSAIEPPIAVLSNDQMQFGVPDPVTELYVTGGKAYNDLPSTVLNLGNAGPFPRNYTVFLDGTKQFLLAPQIIGCVKFIDTSVANGIGTSVQTPEFSMFGNARVTVGLNDISLIPPAIVAGFSVTVQIIGKDATGSSITESLTFVQADYAPMTVPVLNGGFGANIAATPQYISNPPLLFKTTTNVFSSVTSWSVSAFLNMNPQTVVMVWADLKTPVTTSLNNILPVADIRWSGENIFRIRDIRPVDSSIQRSEFVDRMLSDLNSSVGSIAVTSNILSDTTRCVPLVAEDFNHPHWMDNLRTQQSRFSDGLRSYFWPGPTGVPVLDVSGQPTQYAEYYYTRAIYLPITVNQDKVFVHLFADKYNQPTENAKNVVQYRLAAVSDPLASTWSVWTDATVIGSGLTRTLTLPVGVPQLKIQFRFVLHDVRGFTAMMTGV